MDSLGIKLDKTQVSHNMPSCRISEDQTPESVQTHIALRRSLKVTQIEIRMTPKQKL